eukprot:365983-Chlamydomonas_euryale.AAC.11
MQHQSSMLSCRIVWFSQTCPDMRRTAFVKIPWLVHDGGRRMRGCLLNSWMCMPGCIIAAVPCMQLPRLLSLPDACARIAQNPHQQPTDKTPVRSSVIGPAS